MKKNVSFFFLVAVLFILALFTNLSAENPLPQGLSDLITGRTTDTKGVMSGLDDPQIPEAITLCDVLRHKALHKEIKLSPEAVVLFKATLETRLKSSEWVSLAKTTTHILRIPAREIIVEGQKLTIPEHFLAPPPFAVIDHSPHGEAGSLWPEIRVTFQGGKPPVSSTMFLDRKPVPASLQGNTFVFRPSLDAENILAVGSHSVEVVLTDASGLQASASWVFSIGQEETPEHGRGAGFDAVGSCTVPLRSVFPETQLVGNLVVTIFETKEGKRFFGYTVTIIDRGQNLQGETKSLSGLSRFIDRQTKRTEKVTIYPRTPMAFSGNDLSFSFVYQGPGTVTKSSWLYYDPAYTEKPETIESPTFVKKMRAMDIRATAILWIQDPEDTANPFWMTVTKEIKGEPRIQATFQPTSVFYLNRSFDPITVTGTRTISLSQEVPLVPGAFPWLGGTLSVSKALTRVQGPAQVNDPNVFPFQVGFSRPGVVEIFPEIELSYLFESETYAKTYSVTNSSDYCLFGAFSASADVEYGSILKPDWEDIR
jgi:hypothetical protein